MSSSEGPSRVSRPRKSSAATSNGSTASSTGTAEGARTGGSEMRGLEDCDVMAHYLGLPGLNRNPLPRVPDALRHSYAAAQSRDRREHPALYGPGSAAHRSA